MLLFITITCPFGDGHAHFWFPSLSFGKPGASTLAPWGTMGAIQGDLGIHEGHLGVQAWIFIDFGWISGPHFESFSGTLDQNRYLFSCLFPGDLFKRFWGMNLDFWGIKNKHLVWEGCNYQLFTEV